MKALHVGMALAPSVVHESSSRTTTSFLDHRRRLLRACPSAYRAPNLELVMQACTTHMCRFAAMLRCSHRIVHGGAARSSSTFAYLPIDDGLRRQPNLLPVTTKLIIMIKRERPSLGSPTCPNDVCAYAFARESTCSISWH
jgi:hypothetical protein